MIDNGIDLTHPDLNVHSVSYDAHSKTSPSRMQNENAVKNHATPCAGIIGAKANNGIGIVGVAPNSPLMSISIRFGTNYSNSKTLARAIAFAWKNGASVISNSWTCKYDDLIKTEIKRALQQGRNGKGCIVVFSAGNNNQSSISFPANADPDVIVVGAASMCGERISPMSCDGEGWGSHYGNGLDIVAPGVRIPTTMPNRQYTMNFNGTSSACPHVAGAAALLLSVNPNLTQQEVASILCRTATKLPMYSFDQHKEYGIWNKEVGYGFLNVAAALQLASGNKNIVVFNDKEIRGQQSVLGYRIHSQNVLITADSFLEFKLLESVVIFPPFTVESNASFTIDVPR